jgi:hypothetical protein
VATGELVADCSTARAHTVIPSTLAAGTYQIWLVHTDGTMFATVGCTARGSTTITTTSGATTVVGDTGNSACAPVEITVGGAR